MTTTVTILSPVLVAERLRLGFLPRLFGRNFMRGESMVYQVARILCPTYSGGIWDFYQIPGGSGFMVPDMGAVDALHDLTWPENYFDGKGTAQTIGIICTMHAVARYHGENYHKLREYIYTLPGDQQATIWAALD